jgi:hypothetical protein
MFLTKTDPVNTHTGTLLHVACMSCWPDLIPGMIALCSTILRGQEHEKGDLCVVCLELYCKPCKVCGNVNV